MLLGGERRPAVTAMAGVAALCAAGLLLAFAWGHAEAAKAQDHPEARFHEVSRQTIDGRLEQYGGSDADRELELKYLFAEAGCKGDQIQEQAIEPTDRFPLPNVICTLPGQGPGEIIVGAHYDHRPEGRGVADNWSGASLLPSLYESVKDQPARHTILFIGFASEEKGLIGSRFYAEHLSAEQVKQIRVMINIDTLGLGPLLIWGDHSDKKIIKMLQPPGPGAVRDVDPVARRGRADEDSTPFRKLHVPTLMLHSITPATFFILHSVDDRLSTIQRDEYYESYRYAATYLAYLDGKLD